MPKAKKLVQSHGASRRDLMLKATLAAVRRKGPICAGCKMTPADMAFVLEMRAQNFSYRSIVKGLAEGGVIINRHTLEHHMRDGHEGDGRAKA